jgi:hypothetical protein
LFKIHIAIFINHWVCTTNFSIICKWWWHLISIGYKDLLSYSSTITTPSSCSRKYNIKQKFLDVRFSIKNMLHGFFWLHISLSMKRTLL